LGGKLSYYYYRYGLEADAVLHLDDGRFALIEFKLGSRKIDDGALLQVEKYLYNERWCESSSYRSFAGLSIHHGPESESH
jgi:hypothetical protein